MNSGKSYSMGIGTFDWEKDSVCLGVLAYSRERVITLATLVNTANQTLRQYVIYESLDLQKIIPAHVWAV